MLACGGGGGGSAPAPAPAPAPSPTPTPTTFAILTQPVGQTLTAPSAATLSVAADGPNPIHYQWYVGGHAIAGATSATLSIPSTTAFDSGQYRVDLRDTVAGTLIHSNTVTMNVAAAAGSPLDFKIQGLYLVQSTQDWTGSTPLLAGRAAYARIFVQANQANAVAPDVRLRFYASGALQHTLVVPAPQSSVPTMVDEGVWGASWNVAIAQDWIQPGVSVLADVDPSASVAGEVTTNNTYPASGTPLSLQVVMAPDLHATLFPIIQNGQTGRIDATNLQSYGDRLKRIYPLVNIDLQLGSPYTSSTVLDNQGNGFSTMLSEIEAKRVADGAQRHYYGVYRLASYASYATSGIAMIGGSSGLGQDLSGTVDGRNYPEVLAHEMGHNFNRHHTPACGAAGPDTSYPYGLFGSIGVYGLDVETAALKSPSTAHDIMGYCVPAIWISDYVYKSVLAYRAGAPIPIAAQSQREECVLVWGRMEGGRVQLEPGFVFEMMPHPPTGAGHALSLRDEQGHEVYHAEFAPVEMADGGEGESSFAFAIPLQAFGRAKLGSLEVERGGETLARRTLLSEELRLSALERTMVLRGKGGLNLRFDPLAHPMALVRNARTGEVVAFSRDGQFQMADPNGELEVHLSDGVRSQRLSSR